MVHCRTIHRGTSHGDKIFWRVEWKRPHNLSLVHFPGQSLQLLAYLTLSHFLKFETLRYQFLKYSMVL